MIPQHRLQMKTACTNDLSCKRISSNVTLLTNPFTSLLGQMPGTVANAGCYACLTVVLYPCTAAGILPAHLAAQSLSIHNTAPCLHETQHSNQQIAKKHCCLFAYRSGQFAEHCFVYMQHQCRISVTSVCMHRLHST